MTDAMGLCWRQKVCILRQINSVKKYVGYLHCVNYVNKTKIVVVFYFAESIKLKIVDTSIKGRHFRFLPRIAQEGMLILLTLMAFSLSRRGR